MSNIHDGTPLFCPVCDVTMTAKDDDSYFKLFNCCKECGMKWAEVNRAGWLNGWRPDKDSVHNEINHRRSHILNGIDINRG